MWWYSDVQNVSFNLVDCSPPYVNFIAHYAVSITSYAVHTTAFVFKEPEYLRWTEWQVLGRQRYFTIVNGKRQNLHTFHFSTLKVSWISSGEIGIQRICWNFSTWIASIDVLCPHIANRGGQLRASLLSPPHSEYSSCRFWLKSAVKQFSSSVQKWIQQHLNNRLLGLADHCMFCPVNGTILSKYQPRPRRRPPVLHISFFFRISVEVTLCCLFLFTTVRNNTSRHLHEHGLWWSESTNFLLILCVSMETVPWLHEGEKCLTYST